MSENERIKEEIGWLKVVFAVLAAMDASVIAWLVQNFTSTSLVLLFGGLLVVVLLTAGIVSANIVVYKRLAQLERL